MEIYENRRSMKNTIEFYKKVSKENGWNMEVKINEKSPRVSASGFAQGGNCFGTREKQELECTIYGLGSLEININSLGSIQPKKAKHIKEFAEKQGYKTEVEDEFFIPTFKLSNEQFGSGFKLEINHYPYHEEGNLLYVITLNPDLEIKATLETILKQVDELKQSIE